MTSSHHLFILYGRRVSTLWRSTSGEEVRSRNFGYTPRNNPLAGRPFRFAPHRLSHSSTRRQAKGREERSPCREVLPQCALGGVVSFSLNGFSLFSDWGCLYWLFIATAVAVFVFSTCGAMRLALRLFR